MATGRERMAREYASIFAVSRPSFVSSRRRALACKPPTMMISSIPRRASLGILVFAAASPLHATVITAFLLGNPQDTTIWNDLSSGNAALAASSGSGTATLQAPGFQAGAGFYSYRTAYSTTVAQTSSFDINSVIIQLDEAVNAAYPMPTGGPLLSFNGGSQNITAGYFATVGLETRTTVMGDQSYTGDAWQWDLSAYGDDIRSVSIVVPLSVHTSVAAIRVDSAGIYTQAIPEPSAVTLCGLAGLLAFCRRRA